MWLTESQIQLIVEALVPPELSEPLKARGISHLVDRHDAMYLASRNTQFPNEPGQHEWRITGLTKGVPEGRLGGTTPATPNYHYSYKDPAVLADYMHKIHSSPEEWTHDDIHDLLKSKNGPEGRRGGFGERLYHTTPATAAAHQYEDDKFENEIQKALAEPDIHFDTNTMRDTLKKQEESVMYENVVTKIVDGLLEDAVFPVEGMKVDYVKDNEFKADIQPHMGIHKRNKIATAMAGAVGYTPTP